MGKQKSFDEYFYGIIADYFDTYKIDNPVVPNYKIVENIADAYLSLRPDVLRKSSVTRKELNQYNGFAVPPREIDGIFTVLINKNVLLENVQNRRADWVGTIAHETTHVQDFSQYARIVDADGYDEILLIGEHGMFNLWTEIHARARGYYFTRKYTVGGENLQNMSLIPDIKNREIPMQSKMLHENYHATTNGFEQAYFVAQYIGRLYTLQQLYPEAFDDGWVKGHFGINDWMTDWFLFFKEYPELVAASGHFDEMKEILRRNFQI